RRPRGRHRRLLARARARHVSEQDAERAAAPALDERAIDRRLLELLIERHGAPRAARPISAEEQERRDLIARRDRALAAVDRDLVAHLERHNTAAEQLAPRSAAAA